MKAIVLCAGFGSRMKELTKNCPKPMLAVKGRPILEYTIENLRRAGVVDIGINLHYLPSQITDHFGDGSRHGVRLEYRYEDAPSGTAGGVKKFQDFLQDSENFLVIYGDILTNYPFQNLVDLHLKTQALGTIVVHERKKSNSIVHSDSTGRITKFIERPPKEVLANYDKVTVNSAIYCFNHRVLDMISGDCVVDFPKDVFPQLLDLDGLYCAPLEGLRFAIDSPERLSEADKYFEMA